MKKIVVFGKPGGGKSTLSRELSTATGLSLWALDAILYKKNGERVPSDEYSKKHAELVNNDSWIIEGFGTLETFWLRVGAADTLIYVDLPYLVHYWWVTKRLLKSLFVKPFGWPAGSSILKGTLAGWKMLGFSPRFWTPALFEEIQRRGQDKTIYRITSVRELNSFTKNFRRHGVRT